VQSLTVGADGGMLTVGAATLTIPAGALSKATKIALGRHGASDAISLDDTYEMTPDGLHFDKPALFTLEAGAMAADQAGDAEQRWLGYVRGDGSIAPFALPVASESQGMFAGELFHFSSAGSAAPGASSGSGAFGALASKSVKTVAHPLSAKKCRDLQSQYVPADPDTGQPLAAEASVECQLGSPHYASAPGKKGQTCVKLTSFSPASKGRVDYHEWKNAPANCKPAWDAFQNKLAAHEAQHLKIGQQICADAYAAVPVPSGGVLGCGSSVGAARANAASAYGNMVRAAIEAGQSKQDAIDTGNGHGVNMECGCDECDDPCKVKNPQTGECEPLCKDKCQMCTDGQCEPMQCPMCSACDQSSGMCMPSGGDGCSAQKVFCACNGKCYDDGSSCTSECHTTLGCFTGICEPATSDQCQ
jgi:hypothetical protein